MRMHMRSRVRTLRNLCYLVFQTQTTSHRMVIFGNELPITHAINQTAGQSFASFWVSWLVSQVCGYARVFVCVFAYVRSQARLDPQSCLTQAWAESLRFSHPLPLRISF